MREVRGSHIQDPSWDRWKSGIGEDPVDMRRPGKHGRVVAATEVNDGSGGEVDSRGHARAPASDHLELLESLAARPGRAAQCGVAPGPAYPRVVVEAGSGA